LPTLAGEWCDTHDKVSLTQLFKQLPKIQQIKLYLERKGKAKVTVATYTKALKELAKRANLDKTTEVETAIAHYKKTNGLECSKKWKRQLCIAYSHYCKNNKIHWDEQPTYKTHEHSIQPPSKEKCLMLMSSAKGTLSLKIAISIHTGLRPTEITGNEHGLKVRDIHPDTKTITPTSAKGCNARPPIKIPQELATRLLTYIIKNDLKPDDRLFKENPRHNRPIKKNRKR
jgi:hypothetical protein